MTVPSRAPGPVPLSADQRAAWPVVLVSMPFMAADHPSIQLGLLKAVVAEHGFPVQTLHANLDFAARIGLPAYHALCEQRGRLVGDWLFSPAAFGSAAPDPKGRLLERFAAELSYLTRSFGRLPEQLLRVRDHDVPAYLDALVDAYPWGDARVVAFSSTYQQNTASFALARRLKDRFPHLVTIFGGANFDGGMGLELVRAVDCVDLAVTGEGDTALPRLLDALAAGIGPGTVPGVVHRVGETVAAAPPAAPLTALDDLPLPDYSEYFDRAEALELLPRAGHRDVPIPFESARGCWWGAKHHCTFCGLNATTMQFRAKTPHRLLREWGEQARRYRSFRLEAVDNILDMAYLTSLFPAVVDSQADYELFYEVKANLTRAQLRLMAQAGVGRIQPGLESLSSRVLRLMRKGVRAAQNVNLLRWAQYYGIEVAWNVLWGLPGERESDYAGQARVVPHLVHLSPPVSAGRVWLERFSPLFTESDTFPLRHRAPEASYRYIYPDTVDLDRVAYFFEYELDGALPDDTYLPLARAIEQWSTAWESDHRPTLLYRSAPGFLQIRDDRHQGRDGTYTFHGAIADIYLACSDRPATADAVRRKLRLDLAVEDVQEIFRQFQQRGLMFLDESFALALALPATGGR